jgi:hypothetical protein
MQPRSPGTRTLSTPGSGASPASKSCDRSWTQYEVHQAGGKTVLEYWIPPEDLAALNASIVGTIEVTAEYH